MTYLNCMLCVLVSTVLETLNLLNVSSDARREARKAFLAFSSEDASAELVGSELVEGELQNVTELPTGDVKQLSRTTPVR